MARARSVLILQDCDILARALRRSLERLGLCCTSLRMVRELERLDRSFDFGVVEQLLPDGDGAAVARSLVLDGIVQRCVVLATWHSPALLEAAIPARVVVKDMDLPANLLEGLFGG